MLRMPKRTADLSVSENKMSKEYPNEMKLYDHVPNSGIVHLPGRRFPAVAVQGDTLSNLLSATVHFMKKAKEYKDEDIYYEALDLAETGPGVALYSLNHTADREELFKWVGPIGVYEQVFYTLAESETELKDLEEAKKVKKIAVYEGDAGTRYLQNQGFNNLAIKPTDVEALQSLANGEVDLWLGNREGLSIVAAQSGVDPAELVEVPAIVIHANLFIAFSTDVEDEVVQAWQEALDRLKEERDEDDKTFVEKVEAKYNDPAYIDSLIF